MIKNVTTYGVLCTIHIQLGRDALPVQIKEPEITNGNVFKDVSFSLLSFPPGELIVSGN